MQAIARQALALDAAGDRAADTLYAPDALVVANARVRFTAPRFAGVGHGGRITVAAATVTLEGRFAWVMVDYRWTSSQQNVAEAGRATFICEAKPNMLRNMVPSVRPGRPGRTPECSLGFHASASTCARLTSP